mgnify:CR=1 FL=1|tara:strand:- start:13 stop:216 length:204 start_codon:yes stop_codon:yes gene_type:complete
MNFDNQKFKSLSKESILNKKPGFEVFRESVRLPNGEVTLTMPEGMIEGRESLRWRALNVSFWKRPDT